MITCPGPGSTQTGLTLKGVADGARFVNSLNLTGGKVDETIGLSDGGGIVPPTNISSSD